jgi:two-component system, LytTR family, sensor histidine kinase AlgZ
MHPILVSGRRLLLYLAAWIPACALLVYLTRESGAASWRDAATVLAPACAVYAFVCLSPWYICRARLPLDGAQLAATFAAASLAASAVFLASAWLAVSAFSRGPFLTAMDPRLGPHIALLAGVAALLYLVSAGLHGAAVAAQASRDAERRASEARTLAREAELQALRMQINPHFLFNSLHSIAALANADGPRAREMCVRLAAFLRSGLALGGRDSIPLGEELALARSYLEVEQIRFGARLRVVEEIEPGCEHCATPPLLLQPLIENAVKHGVAGLPEGAEIRISVWRVGDSVAVAVENAFDPDNPAPARMGIGQKHVRERLRAIFGDRGEFEAGASDSLYRVSLRFPCASPIASSNRA